MKESKYTVEYLRSLFANSGSEILIARKIVDQIVFGKRSAREFFNEYNQICDLTNEEQLALSSLIYNILYKLGIKDLSEWRDLIDWSFVQTLNKEEEQAARAFINEISLYDERLEVLKPCLTIIGEDCLIVNE